MLLSEKFLSWKLHAEDSFYLILSLIILQLFSCRNSPVDVAILKGIPAIVDTPKSLVANYGQADNTPLFAFVGRKISVDPLPKKPGAMDNGVSAKYLILEKVYGSFSRDTIEFVSYDHYGVPPFSKFENVLIYLSADSGTYYHQKYMYNAVYKTTDGRWAGIYAADDYAHAYNKRTKIKPVKIEFAQKISFPTMVIDDQGRKLEYSYPKPYFETVGDSAFAVYGNYTEDLVTLKRTGYLTARELFEPTAEQEEDMVESRQPEPPTTPPTADDLKFLAFWKRFVIVLNEPGLNGFKKIALDTLYICDQLRSTNRFIDSCFKEVIDDEVKKRIVDRTKLEYTSTDVEHYNLLTSQVKTEIRKVSGRYRLRKMLVTRSTKNNNPATIYFDFIETKKGYRLYAIDHYAFKDCCK